MNENLLDMRRVSKASIFAPSHFFSPMAQESGWGW
jgi:hypothetical protein